MNDDIKYSGRARKATITAVIGAAFFGGGMRVYRSAKREQAITNYSPDVSPADILPGVHLYAAHSNGIRWSSRNCNRRPV